MARLRHQRSSGSWQTLRTGSIQSPARARGFRPGRAGARVLDVSYAGRDPLPDTFKDNAQALVVKSKLMPDGRFVAEQVQARSARRYT